MREERFSEKFGYVDREKPISSREEASPHLRVFIAERVYELGKTPKYLRKIVCDALDEIPDQNNWSDYPNVAWEVSTLLENCEWFYIYDIIEDIAHDLGDESKEQFHTVINSYFKRKGIGWKLENSEILYRGDDAFETKLERAENALTSVGKPTASNEIKEAIRDLSRKPIADITGAIQHGFACLECIGREVTGDKKATLGDLIRKNRHIVPSPLDVVIEKAWGYSSEQGRHLQEGREPSFEEAELMVGLAATLSTYLTRKLPQVVPEAPQTALSPLSPTDDDLPF